LTDPAISKDGIAYLLAFPNPVIENSSLRFVLNYPSFARADIFDMLGKNVGTIFNENLAAGEHKKEFHLKNLDSGIYLIRLNTGNSQKTIRVIKK
jgi:hypothetical protein